MSKFLGWGAILLGIFCLVSPFLVDDFLGHYSALTGLILILVGTSVLRVRKDQLAKKTSKPKE
ncbi:hypothetical protein [Pleionea sp. CnH1-48]|uniref:hypothetical protein n=1 Tax=Pleionea sp. CnH1-48 TaxID=2954494 RepID=UPI002098372B|nr:hypothetical protein [Pleionea sp. CnH1-48]MCO7224628.1 hypothetical protein [Pleionea sp. CnH1-48]